MTVRTVLRRTAWLLVPGALVGACSSQPAAPAATPAPSAAADTKAPEPLAEQALLEDLVLANRILTRTGIFGGLTPFVATSLYEASKSPEKPDGDPYAGLWYPIGVAVISLIIGSIYLSNRKVPDVDSEKG